MLVDDGKIIFNNSCLFSSEPLYFVINCLQTLKKIEDKLICIQIEEYKKLSRQEKRKQIEKRSKNVKVETKGKI